MPILVRGEYILLGEPCQDPAWQAALADITVVTALQEPLENLATRRQPELGASQLAEHVASLLISTGR